MCSRLHPDVSEGLHGADVAELTWLRGPGTDLTSCIAVMLLPSSWSLEICT